MIDSHTQDRWLAVNQTFRSLDTQFSIAKAERDTALKMKAKAEQELDRIPVAMNFLQALSDRVTGDILRSCETAMTDGCRAIIGDDTEIGIEAYVHRNQTKVSIGAVLYPKDGTRILRDIVRDEGGGLTNVVAMILRIIAVARSEQRRFIILDEPDCFLNPTQIPPFFQIVKDMVDNAGFQIVLLTHHAQFVHTLGSDVNVISFERSAGEVTASSSLENQSSEYKRTDIIHGVRMTNFGKHKDLYVPLTGGLNVIVGPSNFGKSRILAAMRCVLCNDGSDSVLHTYYDEDKSLILAKNCRVEIDFDNNKKITWVRRKSGSPVETWELTQNGKVVTLPDGTLCSGKNGPDWVGLPQVLNMRPIAGLWPALHFQKMPIFALDDGVALSGLMSISHTSMRLRAMLNVVAERKRNAERDLKAHNATLDDLSKRVYWMSETLPRLKAIIDEGENLYADVKSRQESVETLSAYHVAYQSAQGMIAYGEKIAKATAIDVPELPDLDAMADAVCQHDEAQFKIWAGTSTIDACDHVKCATIIKTDALADMFADYTRAQIAAQRGARIAQAAHVKEITLPNTTEMRNLYLQYVESQRKANAPIPDLVTLPTFRETKGASDLLARWKEAQARIVHGGKLASVGSDIVPPSEDSQKKQAEIMSLYASYKTAMDRVKSGEEMERESDVKIAAVDKEIEAQRVALGVCPLCGRV